MRKQYSTVEESIKKCIADIEKGKQKKVLDRAQSRPSKELKQEQQEKQPDTAQVPRRYYTMDF